MKVGIPSEGEKGMKESVGEHFGRVPFYTLVDTESGNVNVIPNTSEHMGGRGFPARLLSQHGIEAMLCRGIGRRAIRMFTEEGIKVLVGANGTVEDTLSMLREGSLNECTEDDACTQHAFHGQGGGHRH